MIGRNREESSLACGSGKVCKSLFLAPPLVISESELDQVFDALHHGLTAADHE